MKELLDFIEDVPDFPEKGVVFRDITPLLTKKFPETLNALQSLFSDAELDEVECFAGVDARGFIFASALAARLNKNLVVVRKAGKLPPPVVGEDYQLEYGSSKVEIKPGSGKVIIVDDLIATGGSMQASANLCLAAGYEVIAMATLIDLKFLNDFSWNGMKVRSVIQYDT